LKKPEKLQKFREFLKEKNKYWINLDEVKNEFGEQFVKREIGLKGVTGKKEGGTNKIPHRDLRAAVNRE